MGDTSVAGWDCDRYLRIGPLRARPHTATPPPPHSTLHGTGSTTHPTAPHPAPPHSFPTPTPPPAHGPHTFIPETPSYSTPPPRFVTHPFAPGDVTDIHPTPRREPPPHSRWHTHPHVTPAFCGAPQLHLPLATAPAPVSPCNAAPGRTHPACPHPTPPTYRPTGLGTCAGASSPRHPAAYATHTAHHQGPFGRHGREHHIPAPPSCPRRVADRRVGLGQTSRCSRQVSAPVYCGALLLHALCRCYLVPRAHPCLAGDPTYLSPGCRKFGRPGYIFPLGVGPRWDYPAYTPHTPPKRYLPTRFPHHTPQPLPVPHTARTHLCAIASLPPTVPDSRAYPPTGPSPPWAPHCRTAATTPPQPHLHPPAGMAFPPLPTHAFFHGTLRLKFTPTTPRCRTARYPHPHLALLPPPSRGVPV